MCVNVQLFQHHLLKGLSFLHCIAFDPWLKISWQYLCGSISELYTLCHVSVHLFTSTGKPHFVALHFIVHHRYYAFHKFWKSVATLHQASPSAIFLGAFAHVMSLCHIVIILTIFQILQQQKDYDSLKVQMMVSIFQQ